MSVYGPTKLYERLSEISADRYGSSRNNVVTYILECNPGIEDYGILLPPGIFIDLPDLPLTLTEEKPRQITLWD